VTFKAVFGYLQDIDIYRSIPTATSVAPHGMTDQGIPLFLFTYNCNKRVLGADRVVPRLAESLPDELADLYVFGLEELCSILDGSFEESARQHLIAATTVLHAALDAKYGADVVFHTVAMHHVGAIALVLITPYALRVLRVRPAALGCGYAMSSMKGAVGLRVRYVRPATASATEAETDLTFANAHLSAYEGEHYYLKRNQQVLYLMRSLNFGDGYGLLRPGAHCFFMGDLNYRTAQKPNLALQHQLAALQQTAGSALAEVEDLVIKHDELTRARADGEVFTGFAEPCVAFAPTYKFEVNTAIYSPKRLPLWCDRILYQSTYASRKPRGQPTVHRYDSIPIVLSDHQPVFLSVTVPLEAPDSIVSPTGYLQVLPSTSSNAHVHHKHIRDEGLGDMMPREELLAIASEVMSGPTQIYMLPTLLDNFTQQYARVLLDKAIGYLLWMGTRPRGRLTMLALVLVLWVFYLY
jgi:endonuclease/exonuclease/phosphatase family metal-dependent hydrolase